jgi:RNA polymerase sigma factor (sigma-70 family)
MRDRDLIGRWQRGDTEAGATLLDHYAPFVRSVARRLGVRDDRDFLDLWQDLLLRVLEHLPRLHERVHRSFAGYLAWQVRDLAPRFRVQARVEVPMLEPSVTDPDRAENDEFWSTVRNCEETLPPGERTVFVMRFREGLSLGDVAERTVSNTNAVAQCVFRLVRRMRACMRLRGYSLGGDEK